MRATMQDIADLAGVSVMAVSVVLSGSGNRKVTVGAEKAERIRQIAQELRYRPNQAARTLRTRRTNQVAVVFQHFGRLGPQHPYHIQVLNGVTSALFPAGYAMTLCPKMIVDGDVASVMDGRFDGVLWCRPEFDDESLAALQGSSVPIVMMHVPLGLVSGVTTFCADNAGAMNQVVEHLVSLGHTRMAFVIDPVTAKSVEGEVRTQAFKDAVIRAGMPSPDVIVLGLDHSFLAGYAQSDRPHTALVCFSDELAGFVLRSSERLGVTVPNDVSVVGFDSSPFCETTRPRLTSVRQPVDEMARAATDHLLKLIAHAEQDDPAPAMTCSFYECSLDVRDSTAPPAL